MRPVLLLAALLLTPPMARAQSPTDALSGPVRRLYEDGERLRLRGEWAEAAKRYRMVTEADPSWTTAFVRLGEVLEAQDRPDQAEAVYRRLPFEADAVENLGRLLLAVDRPEDALVEFEKFRNLAPNKPRFLVHEADALSRIPGREADARDVFLEYLGRPTANLESPDTVAVAGRITQALRTAELADESPLEEGVTRAFLETVVARLDVEGADPEGPQQRVLADLVDRFAVEDQAERLSRAGDVPLDDAQRAVLVQARSDLRTDRVREARTALEALVRGAPNSAAGWGALADARLADGDVGGSEWAAIRAEQLAPLDPVHGARLGNLLLDHYGGRADADAAAAFARALARPDAPHELWFRRGLAERRSGQLAQAARSFETYLQGVSAGERADAARQFVDGVGRERVEPPDPPPRPPLPEGVVLESWEAYWVALVLSRPPRGAPEDLTAALDELGPVRTSSPGWTDAINLEAAVRLRLGERERALALYRESLDLAPDQGAVLLVLADLLRTEGDAAQAVALEQRAAALGEPVAHLQIGLRAAADWELWEARKHLEAYLAWPARDRGSERDRRAVRTHRLVTSRIRGLWAGLGGAGLVAVFLPLGLRARSRGGAPLQALLEQSPVVWPDVARILSAIRHEVLKHHTTVLGSVADELEVGDPAPGAWAADRLAGPRGAIARFRAYVEELERLGRVHGVRLNLRHRDPVFGPLIAAVDGLERLEPDLRAGRPKVAGTLRDLAEDLNRTGYRALGSQLRRLCLLPLEADLLREVWSGVQAEVRSPVHLDLDLPEERVLLRIFRGELDDILTNLLRNALEAAAANPAEGGARVGVRVVSEDDPITGLERVAIRVRDNAARRISTAMIRGRYIGRGLGLAVDLISRNGGSVHVEAEPGWEKAVVVRLPRAEAPDLEDET